MSICVIIHIYTYVCTYMYSYIYYIKKLIVAAILTMQNLSRKLSHPIQKDYKSKEKMQKNEEILLVFFFVYLQNNARNRIKSINEAMFGVYKEKIGKEIVRCASEKSKDLKKKIHINS